MFGRSAYTLNNIGTSSVIYSWGSFGGESFRQTES